MKKISILINNLSFILAVYECFQIFNDFKRYKKRRILRITGSDFESTSLEYIKFTDYIINKKILNQGNQHVIDNDIINYFFSYEQDNKVTSIQDNKVTSIPEPNLINNLLFTDVYLNFIVDAIETNITKLQKDSYNIINTNSPVYKLALLKYELQK